MYHHEYPITLRQEAANGALSIFVEGCEKGDVRQQLFGLSVLRSATEAQVHSAVRSVQVSQHTSEAGIMALFAR
jgi:hypothetical protein